MTTTFVILLACRDQQKVVLKNQPSGFEKQLASSHCLINLAAERATQLCHLEYPLFPSPVNTKHCSARSYCALA